MIKKVFSEKVLKLVGQIPKGKVSSYGRIAKMAGLARGGRLVGQILHYVIDQSGQNIPWHRVVNKDGIISTTCLDHPAPLQASLLQKEGIEVINEKGMLRVELGKYLWKNSNI